MRLAWKTASDKGYADGLFMSSMHRGGPREIGEGNELAFLPAEPLRDHSIPLATLLQDVINGSGDQSTSSCGGRLWAVRP